MRRGLSLVDQVLSGLSNFLAVAMVARALDVADFGAFSLAFAMLTSVLGLVRARWGTELSLVGDDAATLTMLRWLLGAALVTAPLLVAGVFLVPFVILGGATWTTLLIVALATPVVCAQDLCRFAAVASGRPGVAVASDGFWVVIVLVGWVAGVSRLSALGLWAGAALVATLVAAAGLRVAPAARSAWSALRVRHATGEVMAVGSVATQGALFVVLALVSLVLGVAGTGSLRGAATLMAPMNALLAFIALALVPHLSRMLRAKHVRYCRRVALALAVAAVAWGVLLLATPDSVGEMLLGETWDGASSLFVWTSVEYAALGVGAAAELGLLARQEARPMLRLQLLYAGLLLSGGLIGIVVAHETWVVAAALAAVAAVWAATCWVALLRSGRRSETAHVQVVGQAEGQGDDGEGRVGPTGRRED